MRGEQLARFPQGELENHCCISGNNHCIPSVNRLVMMLTQSNSLDCHAEREVNGVESKATVKSGEVIIEVSLSGVEEQLAKVHELVETIEKARSLADDLAKGINSIELEL